MNRHRVQREHWVILEVEQKRAVARTALPDARLGSTRSDSKGDTEMKKTTTILAIALGLGSLAACNKSPQQQAADNYEANADNTADQMQSNVDNSADQMTANADNASDAMKAAADNKADAMKNAADNKADAMTNSH
jgi:hypothetical protein